MTIPNWLSRKTGCVVIVLGILIFGVGFLCDEHVSLLWLAMPLHIAGILLLAGGAALLRHVILAGR
jgi:hypothetical protein